MKIIHRITKQEAIEAYKKLNKISKEITVEIEDSSYITVTDGTTRVTPHLPGLGSPIHNTAVPMPLGTPNTYC